jgi:hypothetical protein
VRAAPNGFDGFTVELAGKLAVDISDRVSANMKVCYGCHGFEADMMYFDVRVSDALNVRAGRFSPSFGAFNLRHDPANHRTSDKPLPYDMGRMLRMRQWNLGVLPSPFPDNGVEVNGTGWLGHTLQLDYAAYAVSGFKGDAKALDIDFKLSRSPQSYYVDDNARPAGGGRLAMTLKLADAGDATLGASMMAGTYDPENRLTYAIFGSDLSVRLSSTSIRMEYLARRTAFDTVIHGGYAEIEQAVTPDLDLIGRADGLYRIGNVAAASELSRKSSVLRYTVAGAYAVGRGLRVKLSTELWNFSNRDLETGHKVELSMHAGLAGSF